ncbi:IQ motif, EF-hand binding site [Dillenia turbinata]|uniref:IQ motif, EF-hand binding site n=1 Tax=Dillenia turbinata TaxID=194707 RepID=A0AAN8UYX6_9MAGN
MGTSRNWLGSMRNKLFLPSRRNSRTIIIAHSEPKPSTKEEAAFFNNNGEASGDLTSSSSSHQSRDSSEEDIAAIKILAIFRGHLARRAYGALRSIVKIQAVARGVQVRRQAEIAFYCMHALVCVQVRVRARQLLGRCPD